MRRLVVIAIVSSVVLAGGCTALIGVNDIFLDQSAGEGGVGEGGAVDGQSGSDGSTDASTCNADLTTSKQNCGRCGHDCLGGDCKASQCQAVALGNALAAPMDLAIDGTYAYTANYGDGTIARMDLAGPGGQKTLVTGLGDSLTAVLVSGTTLYWSAATSLVDGGPGGGVFMCALPDCTAQKRLSTIGDTRHMAFKDGYLYFAAEDGVRRVKGDGKAPDEILVNDSNQVYSVAVDDTGVYFSGAESTLRRIPLTGGEGDSLVPLGDGFGFVTLNGGRFFWATSNGTDRAGTAGSAPESNAGQRMTYDSPLNINTVAVTSDGTNVYVANDGLFDPYQPIGNGSVYACPMAGCTDAGLVVLANGLLATGPIVFDTAAVYFLEYGGTASKSGRLLKIAKP